MESKGSTTLVPPLLGCGVCPPALERDGGAEAAVHLGGSLRAPQSLPVEPGRRNGVLDQLPEGVDRWHRYGGVSFCGIAVAQFWAEFVLWESLLNERPYNCIIELGTLDGGFSLYLSSQAYHRGMPFRTYDIHEPIARIPGFVRADIFRDAVEIGEHMREHDPVIVFCDGGNKPRELATFSRYVTGDSLLVVHDWGTEMQSSYVPENVEIVHEIWCEELGSASRCFRVRP